LTAPALQVVSPRAADRPIPHNLDAERSVLGGVLIKPAVFGELDGVLQVDDFFLPAHREIWDAMASIGRRSDPIDLVTLADELRVRGMIGRLEGGEAYLLTLYNNVPTAENVGHYAKLVKQKAILRRLIALAIETAARAAGDCDVDELLAEAREGLGRLEIVGGDGPVRVGDALEAAKDAIEARAANPERGGIMSGLVALDGVLGGFRAGQQIVVASNPGAGKTSFAWSSAIRAASAGVPSLCFSLEMKRQEMVERAITFAGEVPGIGRGSVSYDAWQKIRAAETKLRPLPLWVDDRKLSMGRIAAEARRWRARHAPDGLALLVVDYLGLVRSDMKAENRQLEVAAMSRAFKQLAGDLDVALILVAQLNRQNVAGGIPRKPVLSDLRDSGAIEQDADIVIFPWRDGPISELIIAKHRNGSVGTVPVVWRGDLMAFYDDTGAEFSPAGASDDGGRYP